MKTSLSISWIQFDTIVVHHIIKIIETNLLLKNVNMNTKVEHTQT